MKTTLTLLRIGLKTAQKSNKTELRLLVTGFVGKDHFCHSDTTTLCKRGRTKTERYVALCKHISLVHTSDISMSKITKDTFSSEVYEVKAEKNLQCQCVTQNPNINQLYA